jgi:PadR family transcriptional regulator, regulatory protein AphA
MYLFDISRREMELSATAKVILGMLAARPRSGYEIKQLVDRSARFFWAASYGQIYPELKQLEKEGLINGNQSANGARQRTIYRLTAKGKRAAREWIATPPEVLETRDEGLLKLFFAGSVDPQRAAQIARERAATSRAKAAELRSIERQVEERRIEGPEANPDAGSLTVMWYGIEMNEWAADWFERAAEYLERETSGAVASGGR